MLRHQLKVNKVYDVIVSEQDGFPLFFRFMLTVVSIGPAVGWISNHPTHWKIEYLRAKAKTKRGVKPGVVTGPEDRYDLRCDMGPFRNE